MKERLAKPAGTSRWEIGASIQEAQRETDLSLLANGLRTTDWRQTVLAGGEPASRTTLVPESGVWIIVTRHDNGYWLKYTLRDGAVATPTPEPTLEPTPRPWAPDTMAPDSTFDCDNPPPPGTIAHMKWAVACETISP